MALIDLAKRLNRKAKSVTGVSFVNLIDKFIYQEQLDLLRGKKKGIQVERECERIHFLLARKAYRYAKKKEEGYRQKYFHPSSLGGCARKTFYSHLRAPKNKAALGNPSDVSKMIRVFDNGSFFHTRMQVLFVRMGLCTLDDVEVGFTKGDMQGTADVIATVDGKKFIIDFKSSNSYIFSTLGRNKSEYLKGYDAQMWAYMENLGVKNGLFLYENKDSQQLHEIFFNYSDDVRKENEERLDYLRKCVKTRKPPDREGDDMDKWPCKYCDYTGLCFDREDEKKWLRSLKKSPSQKA